MGRLFEELRRRNVLRTAAAYAVVAWLVVQIAVAVFPVLGVPGWATTMVVVLAIVGFPITVIVSWIYEWTPEGVMTEEAAEAAGYAKPAAFGRHIDFIIIALLIIAVGWLAWRQQGLEPALEVESSSIAVLPFVNMSSDPEQEYFSDGISEEILNVLAQVPGLHVTSRSSAFRFRGDDIHIPTVARQLGVANILEGSVRKSGNRVRITAQLIDAGTDRHLWSGTFERELNDIFAIQDEISAAIVGELSEELGFAMASAPQVQQTTSSAAYDEYLLGILAASRRTGASLEAAKQHFERALELDSDYAPAHARLSITLRLLRQYSSRSYRDDQTSEDLMERQAYHAGRAMALVPDAPESLAAKGLHLLDVTGPTEEVRAIFERVIALNPSYTDVLVWLAQVSGALGDDQASFDYYDRAFRADPLNVLTIRNHIRILYQAGRVDEAMEMAERLRTISPAIYWNLKAAHADAQGLIADAALYRLEQIALDHESLFGRVILAQMMMFNLGLADETRNFNHVNLGVMILHGQTEEALSAAKTFSPTDPGMWGRILLLSGRTGEAADYLNQVWDKAAADGTVDGIELERLVDIGRARQMTGDQAGGNEALETVLVAAARQRAEGNPDAYLDWGEGIARYFLGQKEAGLALVARAVEHGFADNLLWPHLEPLTNDPGFAPILAIREGRVAAQRDKFLGVICNGGNPAPEVWTPKPETCEGYVESGG